MLGILQNTDNLHSLVREHGHFGQETLELLQTEFNLPQKWQRTIEEVGEIPFEKTSLQTLLDSWFGQGNQQVRTAIEQAAAIVYYRHQTSVPVVETIVCDDAGQFKLLTDNWLYVALSPEKRMWGVITKSFRRSFHGT